MFGTTLAPIMRSFLTTLCLVPIVTATISFYDPNYPPGELKGGNWSTTVSKPCRDAFVEPITSCSSILDALLAGGSTFMNVYYPRPNLTDEHLSELCTPQCRSGLEKWVEKQHANCTPNDDILNDNDGWGGAQNLYRMPDFMVRYYWNWCIRDTETKEFCLPTRAQYFGLPLTKACATDQVLDKACSDSCLKQSLALFGNIGQLGLAADTFDWGGNGVRIPKVEALCPDANLTKDIGFPYIPKKTYIDNGVCSGTVVSQMYKVKPPAEPDVPPGVTVWDWGNGNVDGNRTSSEGTTADEEASLETSTSPQTARATATTQADHKSGAVQLSVSAIHMMSVITALIIS